MSESNQGIAGPDSLRLGNMKVDELPFAAAEQTKHQLPEFYATEKLNKIARIKAQYPKQTVDWCDGAIRECQANIANVANMRKEQDKGIAEYTALISQCKRRNRKIDEAKGDADLIREAEKGFPPYNVKAMKHQVGQFKASINRCDDVLKKERESIVELRQLRQKCLNRDELLKAVEAT